MWYAEHLISLFNTQFHPVKCISHTHLLLYYLYSVTGGELFDDIVAREFYSEKDAR